MKKLPTICIVLGSILFVVIVIMAVEFNGVPDNERDDLGYYYVITGGLFPTGNTPNGDNASGGTFRWLSDDPSWPTSKPINVWNKDDWFPENASLALTLKSNGSIVYDNNGLEVDSHDGFYDYADHLPVDDWATPGLYRGYAMSNNWDWIYAGYFKIESTTTIDTIIGYFDPASYGFYPGNPNIAYHVNIWSSLQDNPSGNPNSYMPAVANFTGDVFSSRTADVTYAWSDTGVDRIFPEWASGYAPGDIFRMTFTLDIPLTLQPGVYFFSHDAVIVIRELVDIDIKPGSDQNTIDLSSGGVISVAILGSDTFDATTVDPDTVSLAGAGVKMAGKSGKSLSRERDVNNDGFLDLVCQVLTAGLEIPGDSLAILTAKTYDGQYIWGDDNIRIVEDN